jgi:hypothetical protein
MAALRCHGVNARAALGPLALLLTILPLIRGQPAGTALQVPPDLACSQGPNAKTWAVVKQRFRAVIENHTKESTTPGPFAPVPRDVLKDTIDSSIKEIQAVGGFDMKSQAECGFGKLSLQLLSLAMVDDPAVSAQSITEMTAIASPVLTFLLEIPWVSIALSGWPFFGVLAQVTFNKVNLLTGVLDNEAVDGVVDEVDREFLRAASAVKENGDLSTMFGAAYAYLAANPKGGPFGVATAMATQLVLQTDVQKRARACGDLQDAMRSVVKNPRELDLAMTTRWPLWSTIHIAVDAFAAA